VTFVSTGLSEIGLDARLIAIENDLFSVQTMDYIMLTIIVGKRGGKRRHIWIAVTMVTVSHGQRVIGVAVIPNAHKIDPLYAPLVA